MKALIVDDEVVVRIGLKSIIDWEEEGFDQILEASDGAEALALAIREEPDLILTDIKMPEMDGLELIKALRHEELSACIVVLSSYDDYDFVRQAMGLGAMDYILKLQMTENSLKETLRSVLAKYHVQSTRDISGFSRNLQYLQGKMLKDALLQGGEAERILRDMRKSLQLRINFDQCALALVHYRHAGETPLHQERIFHSALHNTIGEILGDHYSYHCVQIDDGRLCLLFTGSADSLRQEVFFPYGTLIVEMLMNYMNLLCSVCFTPVSASGLHAAYFDAEASSGLRGIRQSDSAVFSTEWLCQLPALPDRAEVFLRYRAAADDLLLTVLADSDVLAFQNKLARQYDEAQALSEAHGAIFLASLYAGASDFTAHNGMEMPLPAAPERFDLPAAEQNAVFERLLAALRAGFESASRLPKVIRDAIRYIEAHYYENITAKDVANHVDLSPSYFGVLFRQTTGSSPTAYIIDLRIRKAQQLLRESNYRVYEIAEMVGYENTFYFSRLFKKLVGCTPNEWRNR